MAEAFPFPYRKNIYLYENLFPGLNIQRFSELSQFLPLVFVSQSA